MVMTIPSDPSQTPKGTSDMMVAGLKEKGFSIKNIISFSADNINGYPAYETTIEAEIKDNPTTLYQLVVVGKEKTVSITGTFSVSDKVALEEAKKLTHTIKLK
jgi:hypothetical protein